MNDAKGQEIWKQSPDYDFIEVSNLGRVRTLDRTVTYKDGRKHFYKGCLLKQRLRPDGYMDVQFSVNGKKVHPLVHRMTATCYIPNPDNLSEVNHKDNDRTNNAVNNLERCTKQYNQDYRKNFGSSPAQLQGRPVYAVDLNTGKVLRFETQSEASSQLGISAGSVNGVVKGKMNQIGGYLFTEDESEITEERIQKIKNKMEFICGVIAINIETSEVFLFRTQTEAARKLGASVGNVNNVLKERQNKTKGCWLCYADEDTVEKTRVKFGDEIANKVEEFIERNSHKKQEV